MIHLGTIRGTTIAVDFSFLILVALFVLNDYSPQGGVAHALLWVPIVFVSILVHELAHAATIGLFGYGPSEIVLGGIGGATMNRRRAKPWHDVIVSLAGPVASFALAYAFYASYWRVPFFHNDRMMVQFIPLLIWANVVWGEFNLLPVAPLDGGHAVRNFLRIFLKEQTAFTIAVWIAILAGAATIVWGIRTKNYIVAILIAWYVFMNYQQWQYFRHHGTPGD